MTNCKYASSTTVVKWEVDFVARSWIRFAWRLCFTELSLRKGNRTSW